MQLFLTKKNNCHQIFIFIFHIKRVMWISIKIWVHRGRYIVEYCIKNNSNDREWWVWGNFSYSFLTSNNFLGKLLWIVTNGQFLAWSWCNILRNVYGTTFYWRKCLWKISGDRWKYSVHIRKTAYLKLKICTKNFQNITRDRLKIKQSRPCVNEYIHYFCK